MTNHFSCYQLTTDKLIYKKRYLFDEKVLFCIGFSSFFFLHSKVVLDYFPMQKSLKILSSSSSTSTFPTIIPRCLVANLKSSAALSKS